VNVGLIKKLKNKILQVILICGVFLGFGSAATAQDAPRAEIFGGYTYQDTLVFSSTRTSSSGWQAEGTVNFYRWFGLTTELGGSYGISGAMTTTVVGVTQTVTLHEYFHTFLFGPQIAWRRKNLTPFAHLLLGEARNGGTEKIVDSLGNTFKFQLGGSVAAMYAGGGMDFKLSDRIAWRAEADYPSFGSAKDVRVSTGIVFRLGKQK